MKEEQLATMSREELIRELRKVDTAQRRVAAKADQADREQLIHDLYVHQIELEMQNRELLESQARLEAATLRYAELYDFAPVGYCTLTPEATIREINLTGAALLGAPREQLVGRSFASVSALADRRPFDAHLERCLTERVRVATELTLRLGGRGARAVHVISEPIPDTSGRAVMCRTILIDISELKELENKLRLLSEAGEALSSSLDATATVNTLVGYAVPALADLCMLDLLREDGRQERSVVAFADARKQDALTATMTDVRPRAGWQTAQARVIACGEPMLLSEVSGNEHLETAHDGRHADALRAAGIRSLIVVPLSARGRTFGALTFAAAESERRYTTSDLRLAQDLANRAAMAMDNARLYAEAQASIQELRAAQGQLHQLNRTLEQRVADRTKWLTLMHAVTRAINDASSWDEALHLVLHLVCSTELWQIGYVYLPDHDVPDVIAPAIGCFGDERFEPFHHASERMRYARGQGLPGRVWADGTPIWVNDGDELLAHLPVRAGAASQAGLKAAAALPIRFGQDVLAVLELFSDQRHLPNEDLSNLMNDVSTQIGKVLERERTSAQMADLVWREQQGLLHTLHDSLGQTLTGLGMMSSGLRRQLTGTNPAAADTARQVAEQAQVALEQVRQLSRGLFPLEIDPGGLLPALRDLASTTQTFHKIGVQVSGKLPVSMLDSRIATQMYRIAQEAVTNAVKHAHAGAVTIDVSAGAGVTKLRVADDGIGIQTGLSSSDGLGLRIMRYRATSIGALLSIEPGSGGGTLVTCTLRDTPRPVSDAFQ